MATYAACAGAIPISASDGQFRRASLSSPDAADGASEVVLDRAATNLNLGSEFGGSPAGCVHDLQYKARCRSIGAVRLAAEALGVYRSSM